ncbi:putative ABC-type xenobiotic transporter [Helianthus annuus]|nr:putative ABC-type xenobiotic transporter [Helianthus annuus]
MRKTFECLRNMRILKPQAWEDKYKIRLEEMRSVEFKWLKKRLYSQAFITSNFGAHLSSWRRLLLGFNLDWWSTYSGRDAFGVSHFQDSSRTVKEFS